MSKRDIYILMYKNYEVLSFSVDFRSYKTTLIRKLAYFDKAPYGFEKASEDSIGPKIGWFFKKLAIPCFRNGYRKIMKATHSRNGIDLLFKGHGLSLSNHYWFKKENENLSYDNINFFTNKWDDSFARAILNNDYEALSHASLNVPDIATAGHNRPIVGYNRHFKYLDCDSGFVLGCFKECFLKDEEITLKPGESITLYTDGITEARNRSGDFFGEGRLIELFNKHDYTCTVELHHTIKDAIAGFVKDAPQSDDITFVTMKYQGGNYSFKEKNFNAVEGSIPQMLDFINDFSDEHKIPEEFKSQLLIVGDELFSNIINHGYENQGGDIFVRLLFNDIKKEFAITIIDQAKAFNQLNVDNPIYGEGKPLEVGGLGLTIVKNIMDDYAYDRINDKNILVLKKRF